MSVADAVPDTHIGPGPGVVPGPDSGGTRHAVWEPRSRIALGVGSARNMIETATAGRRVAVLLDAGLPDALQDSVVSGLRGRPGRLQVWSLRPDEVRLPTLVATAHAAVARLGDVDAVLAVGGGTVLDAAALVRALLAAEGPTSCAALARALGAGRSGLVALPAGLRGPRLIAIPTTVGTAAEVSAAAVVMTSDGRRRLVNGAYLAADDVALDPTMTRTLPSPLLRTGIVESMLRTVHSFIAQPGSGWSQAADDEALELLASLARRGHAAAQGDRDDGLRFDTAVLTCRTVLGPWAAGRLPAMARTWFCANELAAATRVSKMTATAALTPSVWSRLTAGDRRFGEADRLTMAWSVIRRTIPGLRDVPADGLDDLTRRWRLPGLSWPADVTAASVGERALRHWSGGLPMLADLTRDDLVELFTEVQERCAAGSG
ncbi:iron-containing alcohol dehydrogenase [Frankia sp. AgB32]|uniref:iron-containing alcohol dehydrogenase n=1 Tax=Frankia sp. AgB32 TaxID=631119 RepID=UPI00200C1880|nr:iron-containing alcohol dehydrogenase [Frankia sp. AgB32]MCK9896265.1 iron-containing alcohol dehydrogenase [Frankia sp. AgB32]